MAMGGLKIKAEQLEAVGILAPSGLTLIRPEGTASTCTSGKGSLIDSALLMKRFAAAVHKVEAVKTVP